MIFKASMDTLTRGITIGVMLLFLIIVAGQFLSFDLDPTGTVFLSVFLLSLLLFCFLLRPIQYVLTSDRLIVHRLFRDVTIQRKDILKVTEVPKSDMRFTIRTFGVGGLFGYFGKFRNDKIGSMTMYATRKNNTVLIDLGNKKIILTPDKPIDFINQFLPK